MPSPSDSRQVEAFSRRFEGCILAITHSRGYMAGETGPVSLPLAISLTITALFGMACLNCAEFLIMALYAFKRYTGLYF